MGLHKLINPLKNYAWGSPDFIPRLLGKDPTQRVKWRKCDGSTSTGSSSLRTMEGESACGITLTLIPAGFWGGSGAC